MFTKIITWLKVNLASIVGIVQLAIKMVKEILTAMLNFVSIVLPASGVQAVILKIRAKCEQVDAWIEKIKPWLLAAVS